MTVAISNMAVLTLSLFVCASAFAKEIAEEITDAHSLLQVSQLPNVRRKSQSTQREAHLAAELQNLRSKASVGLASCSSKFGKNSTVVVNAVDSKWAPLLPSWAARVRKFGSFDLVICTLDDEAHRKVVSWFASDDATCIVPMVLHPKSSSSFVPLDAASDSVNGQFHVPPLVGLAKFEILSTLSKWGHNSIISESDVFWFKNPVPHLKANRKPISGTLAYDGEYPKEHPGLNIGFLYVRPEAKPFLDRLASTWSEELILGSGINGAMRAKDQEFFNKLLTQDPKQIWGEIDNDKTIFPLVRSRPHAFRYVDCDKSVLVHLTDLVTEAKLDLMQKLYTGTAKCEDLQNGNFQHTSREAGSVS